MSINPNDYSPEETLIKFDHPIPLLRHPIPAGPDNYPTLGFQNPKSFASAYESCESNIIQKCESGARIGCSVSASKNCAPPWWKTLARGGGSKRELIEREECEERVMKECLDAARLNCRKFAEDKCLPAFRDARILVRTGCDDDLKKNGSDLISRVLIWGKCVGGVELWKLDNNKCSNFGVRVVRGNDLLDL